MPGPYTVAELAALLKAPYQGNGTVRVGRAAEPQDAGPDDLALAMSPKFGAAVGKGAARAAILWDGADWQALGLEAAILVSRGRLAMAGVTKAFDQGLGLEEGIHPTAVISPDAEIGEGVSIGPFVVIGRNARIGAGSRIASHASIGQGSSVGSDALIHAGVRIGANVTIGARVMIQPGAVIGSDGFSYVTAERSAVEEARETLGGAVEAEGQPWLRIASVGGVEIGDDVEIGANATIDQGTIRATRIGDGTKIDNMVQIGHNVVVGRHCLLCGQAGIAGSTVMGDFCVMAGQSGAADNITIGSGVIIGAGAGVLSNVPKGKAMMGYPAVAMQTHVEMYKALRRLPRVLREMGQGVKKQ